MRISLKAARVNAGLTQVEAAKRLGIQKAVLIAWERGAVQPSAQDVIKMCQLYGMPQQYIFLQPVAT